MWSCKLCNVIFASESVEQHLHNHHLKASAVYCCGECMFEGESFEVIAQHCMNLYHDPNQVKKSPDVDEAPSRLLTALKEIMHPNESSPLEDKSASTILTTASTPLANINWSEARGSQYESINIIQPPLSDINVDELGGGLEPEGGNMKNSIVKIEPPELGTVQFTKTPTMTEDAKPITKRGTNGIVIGSESASKRSRPEKNASDDSPSPAPVTTVCPHQNPVDSDNGKKPCAFCKMSVKSGDAQVNQRDRSGWKPVQCQTCEKTFIRNGDLKRHETVHTGEKPFACSICGKTFRESGDVKKHERIHTGKKPYSCAACGKKFRKSGDVKKHERIHTGKKPYSCATCGKTFRESGDVKKHERIHTGKKPYSCATCGKSFGTSGDLNKHQRIHTRDQEALNNNSG